MIFKEYGSPALPTVVLLHGGGLSDWSLAPLVQQLCGRFHLIAPVLDGHGEDAATTFLSIEDSAEKLLRYIDAEYGGHLFGIAGLSLGAQIAAELLSLRCDVAAFAVLESALVLPIPGAAALAAPTYALCSGLIQKEWFARAQAKVLALPEAMFADYFADSKRMSRQTLVNITKSNGSYRMEQGLRKTRAKVLVVAGEKERGIMKRSAQLLHEALPGSKLFLAAGKGHGELSLACPEEYAALLCRFFEGDVRSEPFFCS